MYTHEFSGLLWSASNEHDETWMEQEGSCGLFFLFFEHCNTAPGLQPREQDHHRPLTKTRRIKGRESPAASADKRQTMRKINFQYLVVHALLLYLRKMTNFICHTRLWPMYMIRVLAANFFHQKILIGDETSGRNHEEVSLSSHLRTPPPFIKHSWRPLFAETHISLWDSTDLSEASSALMYFGRWQARNLPKTKCDCSLFVL